MQHLNSAGQGSGQRLSCLGPLPPNPPTQPIEITFSYHDGSGHRRSVDVKKGHNIGQFLEIARKSLQVRLLLLYYSRA